MKPTCHQINDYWEGFILELNDQVYDRIVKLCNEGNAFIEKGKDDKAIESYIALWIWFRCRRPIGKQVHGFIQH